jgi:MOSC domain-containing protein YiiM
MTTDQRDQVSAVGTVLRLGAKPRIRGEHGLPKPELARVKFTPGGVEGDYNLYRQTEKAGDPDMAVLLMPAETLAALRDAGWPVAPGDLGENVTTSGVPYEALRPPRRVRIGGAVVQTTKPCEPCTNLYLLPYVGEARGPAFLKATLGRRGWFARVLEPGVTRKGDRIELLDAIA